MKLQTNASNGIMGMDFILVIYLVITVSFASRAAVLSLPNSLPDWLFHCLPGREILKHLPLTPALCTLHLSASRINLISFHHYMYVRKRNSKIQQSWNSSISQRLSPFLRIIATEQAILLHNGENHMDYIVTSGDSDSACPVSINTNRFGVVIHFFHPRCTFQSINQTSFSDIFFKSFGLLPILRPSCEKMYLITYSQPIQPSINSSFLFTYLEQSQSQSSSFRPTPQLSSCSLLTNALLIYKQLDCFYYGFS